MTRRLRARHRFIAAFLLGMAVANGITFWQERGRILAGYGDFSALYTGGSLARQGQGRALYDLRRQWSFQQENFPTVDIRRGPMPYIRPPFEALVFLPLTFFRYPVALALWSLTKVILLWLAIRWLPRPGPFGSVYPPWFEAVLCLGFFPVFLDLFQGQDAILLLLMVAATLNRLQLEKNVVAGLVLALGLFKFLLVVPIAIMVALGGRPRILAGFLPGAAILVAVSCVVSGVSVLSAYPLYLLSLNRASGVGVVTAQSMPNLRGVLSAFLGRAPYPGAIHWLLLPAAVAAIVLTARLWRATINRDFRGLAFGYCLALLVAILTSYYAYTYDMTLLLVPLLLLGGEFIDQPNLAPVPRNTVARNMMACGWLLLICTPLYWALILRVERPYLLALPMFILALGIAGVMQGELAATP